MTDTPSIPDVRRAGLVLALREVIDALDRRLPQIEHAGETRIARDAMMLRREATERLAILQQPDAEALCSTAQTPGHPCPTL